jgi:hypothetical protein
VRAARAAGALADVPTDVGRLADVRIKYAGYIARQDKQIERFAQLEQKLIPRRSTTRASPACATRPAEVRHVHARAAWAGAAHQRHHPGRRDGARDPPRPRPPPLTRFARSR